MGLQPPVFLLDVPWGGGCLHEVAMFQHFPNPSCCQTSEAFNKHTSFHKSHGESAQALNRKAQMVNLGLGTCGNGIFKQDLLHLQKKWYQRHLMATASVPNQELTRQADSSFTEVQWWEIKKTHTNESKEQCRLAINSEVLCILHPYRISRHD